MALQQPSLRWNGPQRSPPEEEDHSAPHHHRRCTLQVPAQDPASPESLHCVERDERSRPELSP
jgi:hypothetical protein